MARTIKRTKRFKKDQKRILNQRKDINKLTKVVKALVSGQSLDAKYRDHPLIGNWKPSRECHIESDWLLIYDISEPGLLILVRTGSHSELFS